MGIVDIDLAKYSQASTPVALKCPVQKCQDSNAQLIFQLQALPANTENEAKHQRLRQGSISFGPNELNGNDNRVFGCTLEELDQRGQCLNGVPLALICLCEYLRLHPSLLAIEGMFRLSPDSQELLELVSLFDSAPAGLPSVSQGELQNYTPIAIAVAIKKLFRDLPEPLLTDSLYDSLLIATRAKNWTDITHVLEGSESKLPSLHKTTLKYLIQFLVHVASFPG